MVLFPERDCVSQGDGTGRVGSIFAAISRAPGTFRQPAPCVSRESPGERPRLRGDAEAIRIALTAFGVSAGFSWSTSATAPLTTGAAMLVPLSVR